MPIDNPPAIVVPAPRDLIVRDLIIPEPERSTCASIVYHQGWLLESIKHLCPNWSQDTLTDEDRRAGTVR